MKSARVQLVSTSARSRVTHSAHGHIPSSQSPIREVTQVQHQHSPSINQRYFDTDAENVHGNSRLNLRNGKLSRKSRNYLKYLKLFTISIGFKFRASNTMAFGGVATGNMNANEIPMVTCDR